MVIRSYVHGGFYGLITGGLFLGKERPLKELIVGEYALRQGIPTNTILAALCRRVVGPFYRSWLITREIPEAPDLIGFLENLKVKSLHQRATIKRRLIGNVATAIRRMHDRGIYHADLHLKNILVGVNSEGEFSVYLIDFDKSRFLDRFTFRFRMKNLMRLNRSAEKMKRLGLPITTRDQMRFLREYFREEPENFKKAKKRLKPFLLLQEIHRFGWRFLPLPTRPTSR